MSRDRPISNQQIAEAAAWVAHLHGAQRTADSDKGHRLWLAEDPARERAWEVATEVWDDVAILQSAAIAKGIRAISPRAHRKGRVTALLAAAAATSAVAIGLFLWSRSAEVATATGEQRTLTLDDGSRVILNTATRVVVLYDSWQRKIELKSGEARFDVAWQSGRPFVVTAGGRQVEALGTSFIVRYDPSRTVVTLVEGKVRVSSRGDRNALPPLEPGERLTFARDGVPHVDRPLSDRVAAWQRGQVVMDGMHLKDAMDEMNRYSDRKLELDAQAAADLLVSGVFQSGDSLSFANAVAHTYRLRVVEEGERILLTGTPQAAYRRDK